MTISLDNYTVITRIKYNYKYLDNKTLNGKNKIKWEERHYTVGKLGYVENRIER